MKSHKGVDMMVRAQAWQGILRVLLLVVLATVTAQLSFAALAPTPNIFTLILLEKAQPVRGSLYIFEIAGVRKVVHNGEIRIETRFESLTITIYKVKYEMLGSEAWHGQLQVALDLDAYNPGHDTMSERNERQYQNYLRMAAEEAVFKKTIQLEGGRPHMVSNPGTQMAQVRGNEYIFQYDTILGENGAVLKELSRSEEPVKKERML